MKRLCLLAGFHPKGQISDYVVHYARALSQLADVYYMADCHIPEEELKKLSPYVKGAWAKRHGKYDFGSWQELINKLGWEFITQYNECIFANDSVFAPLFPLAPIFERADKNTAIDAWALNSFEGKYFGSFFFVLRNQVLLNGKIQQFFNNVTPQQSVGDVISNYEKKLPALLTQENFSYQVVLNRIPSIFNQWKSAVLHRFPVLKIQPFTRAKLYGDREYLPGWHKFLAAHTDYPLSLIEQHLRSLDINPDQFDSWIFKLKSLYWCLRRWRQKAFRIHFHKKERIVVLLGWTIVSTLPNHAPQIKEL